MASETFGKAGGSIGPASAGNLSVLLTVPPNAKQPLQYTITEPNVADIAGIGFCPRCGCRPEAGVGVIIQYAKNGKVFRGFYRHNPIVTISSPSFRRRWRVVQWNGASFQLVPGVKVRHHTATIPIVAGGCHFYAVVSGHRLRLCPRVRHHHGAATAIGAKAMSAMITMPFGWMIPGVGALTSDVVQAPSQQVTLAACYRRMPH